MLEVLFTILWLEKGLTSFNKDISTNFSGEKKSAKKLSEVFIFWESNLVLVVAVIVESKGLY